VRRRACATVVAERGGVPLCPACAAVTGDLGVMIRTSRHATGTA
jgi:hypothetical protein